MIALPDVKHLCPVTLENKGRLVTFDGGIADVLPPGIDSRNVLTVLAP